MAYYDKEFLNDLVNEIQEQNGITIPDVEMPEPSLLPLTSYTSFSLERINDERIKEETEKKLSFDFGKKNISVWLCQHGNTFHRRYNPLKICNAKNPKNLSKWSPSFNFLMSLCCVILSCDQRKIYILLNQIEKHFLKCKKDLPKRSYNKTGKHSSKKKEVDNDVSSDSSETSDISDISDISDDSDVEQ